MAQAKLLIFIPTYNRAPTIKRQLMALLPQISQSKSVHLIVSNNCSEDDSEAMIAKMVQGYENAELQTTPANVGANANALNGFSCSFPSDYLWVLSDDTHVAPSAVSKILSAAEGEPDLISITIPGVLPRRQEYDIRVHGIGEVFSSTSWGQFGCLIYSRKYIRNSIDAGYSYHESSFPHLAILFDSCWRSQNPAKVKELVYDEVFEACSDQNLNAGVYSLSLAGRPMLLNFGNPTEARTLAIKWSRSNALGLATFRFKHPVAWSASRYALICFGGFPARINMFLGEFLYLFLRSWIGEKTTKMVSGSGLLTSLAVKTGIVFFTLPIFRPSQLKIAHPTKDEV